MKPKLRLQNRLAILLYQKELRDKRRVTQTEVAAAIGVSRATITNWMHNDVTKFEAHIIEGLCAFFECGLCDLLYLEDVSDEEE
ncbi:MAG: helix-turn-helix transcriptional regulator [Anaerolinea sp.]|nr:helix-turn-helix transcriptional regulator [Anaerolinea sp.]